MKSKVFWLVELKIVEQNFEKIKSFMDDVFIAAVNDEPNTLSNEWFISDDKKICHMIDRYTDSEAVLNHLNIFAEKFNDRFNAYFELTRFIVYGNPNEEVKKAVAGFNPIYLPSFSGFEK
ncbi:MAG: hypothetical protein V1773_04870 [bacterium]